MATIEELKSVLKDTLHKQGVLDQMKAQIRSEIFKALDEKGEERPNLSNENFIINELIREYLEFNQYRYTSSILKAESGQPEKRLDREFLKRELNIIEDKEASGLPLLYGIVAFLTAKTKYRVSCDRCQSPPSKLLAEPASSRTVKSINIHQPQEENDI